MAAALFTMALASVSAAAADGALPSVTPPVILPVFEKPARPARPEKPLVVAIPSADKVERPNLTEIKDIVKSFQDQKTEYIKQQQDAKKDLALTAQDSRAKVREELNQTRTDLGALRQELRDSIEVAKRQAQEQARRVAEEAKEAAKNNRDR